MNAKDPVHQDWSGWWFWDETWADRTGPFLFEADCREAMRFYVISLDRELTDEETALAKPLFGLIEKTRRHKWMRD